MFRECLRQIADRCGGLLGVSLVGRDGLPIDSLVLDESYDLEMLSAELVALAQAARENHSEFGGGPLRSLVVETDTCVLMLGEAAEDVYLLLFLNRDCGPAEIARARFELRRAPLIVVPALFGPYSQIEKPGPLEEPVPTEQSEPEQQQSGHQQRSLAPTAHGLAGEVSDTNDASEAGFSRALPSTS